MIESIYSETREKMTKTVTTLENELKKVNEQEETLHYAVNVLNLFGPVARSALQTVKTLQEARGESKYIGRVCQSYLRKYNESQN